MLALAAVALPLLAACTTAPPGAAPGETPSIRPPSVTVAPEPGLAPFYGQRLDWAECGDDRCATLTVPVDYDEPARGTLGIAVRRAPATGEGGGILVVNPGGPGGSGVELAANSGRAATDAVRQRYDIVGFDPRGVGESAGIRCFAPGALDRINAGESVPEGSEGASPIAELIGEVASSCETTVPGLLAEMSTVEVARDLDVLRSALGQERLDYLGLSYGTHIGATYAALFPDRVGRFVLDGPLPAGLDAEELGRGQAAAFEDSLRAFVEWCLEGDECPLGSSDADVPTEAEIDAAVQRIAVLLDSLGAAPVPTDDPERPLTEGLAGYAILLHQYLPDYDWPRLSQALAEALEGRGGALLDLLDDRVGRLDDGSYRDNSFDAFLAVTCLDRGAPPPLPGPADIAAWREASPTFGADLAWATALRCREWPHGSRPPVRPAPGAALPPILIVATTGDPATPYPWAEVLAQQLGTATIVTYEGLGHLAYNAPIPEAARACIDAAVDAFLLDGVVPAAGLRCAA